MKILGISAGDHSCGLSLIDNGKIIFSLEEERHSRTKGYKDFYSGFFRHPSLSFNAAITKFDFNIADIDYITSYYPKHEVKVFWDSLNTGTPFPEQKFIFVDHHDSHAATAYYLSGFQDDTLVVTMDASGGNYSAKYFVGSNGNLEYIDGLGLKNKSFGHYYAMLTEFLGFKRLKDEGKVVGMAGHGSYDMITYQSFKDAINIEGIHTDKDDSGVLFGQVYVDFYNSFYKRIGSKVYFGGKENLAYNGQFVFEEKIVELLTNLHNKYPNIKKIALAGGVFANVKLNKRINEQYWVEEAFIAPPMGDEGCPLGCALMVHKMFDPNFKPFKLNDVYMGTGYDDIEVGEQYWDMNKFSRELFTPEKAAKYLAEGKIMGVFNGRYEHGPRALGNRSIIGEVTNPDTYDKINNKLKRNDFMPFAPAVMEEHANKIFKVDKSAYTAQFMTMLYDTRPEWADRIPTVVHPKDKTARIQIVTPNSNPTFYKILDEYNKITGVPVLLNTSFNVHEEPIVCHPNEAFAHLENDVVDLLIINNFIYRKYEGNIN
jgi:carbamoyltransferase